MNILEYAIQMEKDGEAFYRQEAEKNKGTVLEPVFLSLADDEKAHAAIVKEKLEDVSVPEGLITETEKVFSGAGEKSEGGVKSQTDAYRTALGMEAKSIEVYRRMQENSQTGKEILAFLIEEEETHYRLLEEIIEMLRSPQEWVESAEFGKRKDY